MTSQNHVGFRQVLENFNKNKAISKTALKHAVKTKNGTKWPRPR